MPFEPDLAPTLSRPRVEPYPHEAIGCWLFRLGQKLLLTDDEVNAELGFPAAALDRAPTADRLRQAAARTGRGVSDLQPLTHAYFNAHPSEGGCIGLTSWAACPACLAEDREMGRSAHVRVAWLHPLSSVCLEHDQPLIPVAATDSEEGTDGARLLCTGASALNPMTSFELEVCGEASLLASGSDAASNERLTHRYREVSDIADALATQANVCMGPGSLESSFEDRWWGARIRSGAVEMPDEILPQLAARDRLSLVRIALRILGSEEAGPSPDPVVEAWVDDCSRLRIPRVRLRSLRYASVDPLIIIALALPVHSFHRLGARAEAWSPAVRARWQAASTVAAFSGFA